MNIGAGDPTRPIPSSLDVLVVNESFSFIYFILHILRLAYNTPICFLTRGFVRPQ